MKIGVRKPSIKKTISAKTSIKRQIIHKNGLRMPKGTGWIRDPKKAAYNKIYHKTTIKSPTHVSSNSSNKKGQIDSSSKSKFNKKTNLGNKIMKFMMYLFLFFITYTIGLFIIIEAIENNNVIGPFFMVIYPIFFIWRVCRKGKKSTHPETNQAKETISITTK